MDSTGHKVFTKAFPDRWLISEAAEASMADRQESERAVAGRRPNQQSNRSCKVLSNSDSIWHGRSGLDESISVGGVRPSSDTRSCGWHTFSGTSDGAPLSSGGVGLESAPGHSAFESRSPTDRFATFSVSRKGASERWAALSNSFVASDVM